MSAVAGRTPMHLGGLADEDLVRLARAGNEAAFDAIVHRYRAPLQAYCRRWVDCHRAEEVVQHTLMKAFLCVRDDARPLVLRPWLYRVAHNAALNAVEKKGSDWEQLDENYDGVPQPPQVAERRASFLKLVDGIGALPARQREALLLNEFEGRCYADIAAELGTSESGVRGLLRRARRQLRDTAAALLFPFPVLREFVRSDGGRALPVDRAGEIMTTAGAAGGVGAAGGFAKVAAGVLAAGTIASGGSAIQHRDDPLPVTDGKADVGTPQSDGVDALTRALYKASAPATGAPFTVSTFGTGGTRAATGGGLIQDGGVHAGVDGPGSNPEEAEEPPAIEEEPLVPLGPVTGETGEQPQQDPAANEGETGEPQSGTTDPGTGPTADSQPPPDESTDGSQPGAVVATPDPLP